MKKTYIMPQSAIVRFNVEGMLAASAPTLGKFVEDGIGGSDGLSNERGWSSESWSNTDED